MSDENHRIFVAQRPSTNIPRETWGNFGETRGGVGNCSVLEHKSGNISETRKDRWKVTWRACRNSPTIFRAVPSPTPYPSPRLGVCNPTQNCNRYYLRNWLQIWPIHSQGPSEQKPIKNFGEKGAWAYPGTAQIFGVYPLISQEQVKLRTSNLAGTFIGSIGTKAH